MHIDARVLFITRTLTTHIHYAYMAAAAIACLGQQRGAERTPAPTGAHMAPSLPARTGGYIGARECGRQIWLSSGCRVQCHPSFV
jgi:hypothetical protein